MSIGPIVARPLTVSQLGCPGSDGESAVPCSCLPGPARTCPDREAAGIAGFVNLMTSKLVPMYVIQGTDQATTSITRKTFTGTAPKFWTFSHFRIFAFSLFRAPCRTRWVIWIWPGCGPDAEDRRAQRLLQRRMCMLYLQTKVEHQSKKTDGPLKLLRSTRRALNHYNIEFFIIH